MKANLVLDEAQMKVAAEEERKRRREYTETVSGRGGELGIPCPHFLSTLPLPSQTSKVLRLAFSAFKKHDELCDSNATLAVLPWK